MPFGSINSMHAHQSDPPPQRPSGINDYVKLALEFAYGADSPAMKEKCVAGVQTISGTGACRLAGDFYARFLGKGSPLYLPNPTWCVSVVIVGSFQSFAELPILPNLHPNHQTPKPKPSNP